MQASASKNSCTKLSASGLNSKSGEADQQRLQPLNVRFHPFADVKTLLAAGAS